LQRPYILLETVFFVIFSYAVIFAKRLNEQVKRNLVRFPEDFMFRLTLVEWQLMRSQIATTPKVVGEKIIPHTHLPNMG
jgi:ORF6N domain